MIVGVLSVGLAVSNLWISHTAGVLVENNLVKERTKIEEQSRKLNGQMARLSSAMFELKSEIKQLAEVAGSVFGASNVETDVQGSTEASEATPSERVGSGNESAHPSVRDPRAMPLLSEEEKERLGRIQTRMRGLSLTILRDGGVEGVIADSEWNPEERELSVEERKALAEAIEEYRFYAFESREKRFEQVMKPELKRLREAGAYVEYGYGERPPKIPEVKLTTAEPAPDGDTYRLYYFYPEDYPDLYRWVQVEKERAREAAVNAFAAINGDREDSSQR